MGALQRTSCMVSWPLVKDRLDTCATTMCAKETLSLWTSTWTAGKHLPRIVTAGCKNLSKAFGPEKCEESEANFRREKSPQERQTAVRGNWSDHFFPYKFSYHLRYWTCCQILYSTATDLKRGSSTYFFLLFSFLLLGKCQVLSLRVGRSRDQVMQRAYWVTSTKSKFAVRKQFTRSADTSGDWRVVSCRPLVAPVLIEC